MKKVKITAVILMVLAIATFVPLLAGPDTTAVVRDTTAVVPTPATSPTDISTAFAGVGALIAFVTAISEGLTRLVQEWFKYTLQGWASRIVSWLVAIVVAGFGIWLQIGFFSMPIFQTANFWIATALSGLALGLTANGLFTIKKIRFLLALFKIRVPELPDESGAKAAPDTQ